MLRRTPRHVALMFCAAAVLPCLFAQSEKTITIRILDGKTGKPIPASGFQVRVDRQQTAHVDWAAQSEDGTARLTLPPGASLISIQATYENSTQIYVNCDSATGKATPVDRWYPISEILASGVVAPDGCVGANRAARFRPAPKSGEFVFFVRRMTTREEWRE